MSTDDGDSVGGPAPVPVELRSSRWYGQGPFSFEHRGRTMQSGFSLADFEGRKAQDCSWAAILSY